MRLSHLASTVNPFADVDTVHAHCDLMCGTYDPELARIEAESCYNAIKKYHDSDDELFRQRAILIKEERADLAKEQLWVLWTDYFKPKHLDDHPNLHDLFWRATKQAGDVKKSLDIADAEKLLDLIDEIDEVFKATGGWEGARLRKPTGA